MLDHIGLHDTIGFALTAHNVATSSGTLLFSRALFDRLEGFRDFRYVHDWDFCLRATLDAEPVYVGRELYDYRLHGANTILAARDASGAEVSSLLSAFYADAAVRADARNPFAPVAAVWGRTFALRAIEANATRFLPPGFVERLADDLLRDERRGSGARVGRGRAQSPRPCDGPGARRLGRPAGGGSVRGDRRRQRRAVGLRRGCRGAPRAAAGDAGADRRGVDGRARGGE
jgi:hypothetical protein